MRKRAECLLSCRRAGGSGATDQRGVTGAFRFQSTGFGPRVNILGEPS